MSKGLIRLGKKDVEGCYFIKMSSRSSDVYVCDEVFEDILEKYIEDDFPISYKTSDLRDGFYEEVWRVFEGEGYEVVEGVIE